VSCLFVNMVTTSVTLLCNHGDVSIKCSFIIYCIGYPRNNPRRPKAEQGCDGLHESRTMKKLK